MNISVQIKNRFPIISLLLVFSCLISSIPQLFLPSLYNFATGQFPSLSSIYLITLPVFTHAPHIFINHLFGNLLVIIIFGGFVEIIIGSSRFALLTLFTFFSTTSISYFHSINNGGYTHGASGICYGYIMFFIFFLIIVFENKKISRNTLFKLIIPILLAIFAIIGIPILEVVVLNMNFFENFGQTVHLMSYSITIPFLILWRKDFEKNSFIILDNKRIEDTNNYKSISIIILIAILLINVISTGLVAKQVLETKNENFTYNLTPGNSIKIEELDKMVQIHFEQKMLIDSEHLSRKSINYTSEKVPSFEFQWIDSHNAIIQFSRFFKNDESIFLEYKIKREVLAGIKKEEQIVINYGLQ